MIKKIVSGIVVFSFLLLICASTLLNIHASSDINELGLELDDSYGEAYLYNYESDRVLFCNDSQRSLMPASTAKMMAGLIACEIYADKLDTNVTITEEMLDGREGTSMNLQVGMTVTIRELFHGTVFGNNDAAQALAIACAGSLNAFVKEMNAFANRLYMKNTVYKNPTGLDADGAKTTLSDTVRLAHRAAKNDVYISASSASSFEFTPQDRESATVYNRNALASQFSAAGYTNKYAKGLIAGNTDEGGYVLAAYAQRNGASYLCVVMGAQVQADKIGSYAVANTFFDRVFNRYSLTKIAQAGDSFLNPEIEFAVTNGDMVKLQCIVAEDVHAFISYDVDVKKNITCKPYLHSKKLSAPITQGDVVGGIDFYCGETLIASAPLVAKESIEANPILYWLEYIKDRIFSRAFLMGIGISFVFIAVYLYYDQKATRHKKVATVRFNKFS